MAGYTPTPEQAEETYYDAPGMQASRFDGLEFQRMLAQVRAKAKVEALVSAAENPALYREFDSTDRHAIRQRLMGMALAIRTTPGTTETNGQIGQLKGGHA